MSAGCVCRGLGEQFFFRVKGQTEREQGGPYMAEFTKSWAPIWVLKMGERRPGTEESLPGVGSGGAVGRSGCNLRRASPDACL